MVSFLCLYGFIKRVMTEIPPTYSPGSSGERDSNITSVRRIHGKRISDAELTIITNLTNLFPIKNDNYWLKIGKIGNYCQFSTKGAYLY